MSQETKLGVFISYSRKDLEFADQLVAAHYAYRFGTTIDRQRIHGAKKWEERLSQLILDADTIVFILTLASIDSDVCRWEVDEAVKHGKRIVPILWLSIEDKNPHKNLQDLNYIYFYSEPTGRHRYVEQSRVFPSLLILLEFWQSRCASN